MPATRDLADGIETRLAALGDHSVAALRRFRRTISRELQDVSPAGIIAIARRLKASAVPRWFAYELVNQPSVVARLTTRDVEFLGRGLDSWGDVDAFACYVAGPAFRERRLTMTDIGRWAGSGDRWWRRAALVSTVPLNNTARGGHGDATRTLAVCDRLRLDRDDMVVKAMSWSLRELAKKDARSVSAYVRKHRDELAPRVLREVNHKLKTGLKNPRRERPR